VFTAQDGPKAHIYVVSAKGGKARRLTAESAEEDSPYWSHDGKWVYFASDRIGRSEIWRIPSKGGEAVQITSHEGDAGEESPDGRFFYYSKGWPLETSVWRMPVNGGQEVKVLDSVHPAGAWTFAREGIYFFTFPDQAGRSDIRLYEFSTGKASRLLTIERGVDGPIAASPDGRWILYTHLDDAASDLMLVENYR
jgi:Tol biopolymer transport system component